MDKKFFGSLMLALAASIWGAAFVAQDIGMEYMGPASFMAVRFFLGGAVLLPVIIVR
ncbi:MAG: EamA family transporter, partial [Synergistaceae bacterium]|nr:EamA family transporter [Synergistaceae bacterium]